MNTVMTVITHFSEAFKKLSEIYDNIKTMIASKDFYRNRHGKCIILKTYLQADIDPG